MTARTRRETIKRALPPFFLPDLPGCGPDERVVVGGIAVLAVLTRAAGRAVLSTGSLRHLPGRTRRRAPGRGGDAGSARWSNHRRRAQADLTRSGEPARTSVRSHLAERQEIVKS